MTDAPPAVTGETEFLNSPESLYNLREGQEFISWNQANESTTGRLKELFLRKHPNEEVSFQPIKHPGDLAMLQMAQIELISRLQNVYPGYEKIEPVEEKDPRTGELTGGHGFIATRKPQSQTT